LNLKELKEILQILEEKEITEFELEEQGLKLRIRKAGPPLPMTSAVVPLAAVPPQAASNPTAVQKAGASQPASPAPAEATDDPSLVQVKSPIVGTFYRSPDPASPSFVNVGDRIRVGQVLCIIEAMKLMNEIEAEVAGEVVKVYHENGQPVQYGEPLFAIRVER
jgi:acetyl-CoA carboxylase biotin carboxyl carrier protein